MSNRQLYDVDVAAAFIEKHTETLLYRAPKTGGYSPTSQLGIAQRKGQIPAGMQRGKIVPGVKKDRSKSNGWCTRHTISALRAGLGISSTIEEVTVANAPAALSSLPEGFIDVTHAKDLEPFQAGDIAICIYEDPEADGHVCMYTGKEKKWMSDYQQGAKVGKGTIHYFRYTGPRRIGGQIVQSSETKKFQGTNSSDSIWDKLIASCKAIVELIGSTAAPAKIKEKAASKPRAPKPGAPKPTNKPRKPVKPTGEPAKTPADSSAPADSAAVSASPLDTLIQLQPTSVEMDSTKKANDSLFKSEQEAEQDTTRQEGDIQKDLQKSSSDVNQDSVKASGEVLSKLQGGTGTLGSAVKADQIRSAQSRAARATRGAFKQGLAFGWPVGPIVGAAASAATYAATAGMIVQMRSVVFAEDGGPIMGSSPRAAAARKRSSDRRLSVNPQVNLEIEGQADPASLSALQGALSEEIETFARNLELERDQQR